MMDPKRYFENMQIEEEKVALPRRERGCIQHGYSVERLPSGCVLYRLVATRRSFVTHDDIETMTVRRSR
jgi:hypothetical protein